MAKAIGGSVSTKVYGSYLYHDIELEKMIHEFELEITQPVLPVYVAPIVHARIVSVVFNEGRHGLVTIVAVMEDGIDVVIGSYYSDELSFCEREFIGLTIDCAKKIKQCKDVTYLQSK